MHRKKGIVAKKTCKTNVGKHTLNKLVEQNIGEKKRVDKRVGTMVERNGKWWREELKQIVEQRKMKKKTEQKPQRVNKH